MDIGDLLSAFGAGKVATAQSRLTRTPVVFDPDQSDKDYDGQFNQGTPAQTMISLLPMLKMMRPPGEITVFPNSTENQKDGGLGNTIRHESVHALMYGADPLNRIPPPSNLQQVADPYLHHKGGNQLQEAPAYAVEDPDKTPFPQEVRESIAKSFAAKLAEHDPKAAAIYKRLARID